MSGEEITPNAQRSTPNAQAGKWTNIHDYLEMIGAEPPPVDSEALAEAKKHMVMCDSFEEVVDTLELLDAAEDVINR